ncbi:MAG: TetR/AcrR family transcriptional regulator [Planctomycetes bacterium]|nr:TetR/AcrR family transcriptional regulator [Planctomycetota bacterium]
MAASRHTDTAERILDIAEKLVQQRGYNAFSYADIAAAMRISKASIHHHFLAKADLAEQLIVRYHQHFVAALAEIDQLPDPRKRLRRFVQVYLDVLRSDRMCLCGMLAAEIDSLPKPVRDEVRRFFTATEDWLSRLLAAGRRAGTLAFTGSPDAEATLMVTALEGAMLVARSYGDVRHFEVVAERLLAGLGMAH